MSKFEGRTNHVIALALTAPLAPPLGELSAKLTERALSAPVCALGHLSQRERQGRLRRLIPNYLVSYLFSAGGHEKQAAAAGKEGPESPASPPTPAKYQSFLPGDHPLPPVGRVCPPAPVTGSITQFWVKVYYYFSAAGKTGEFPWNSS